MYCVSTEDEEDNLTTDPDLSNNNSTGEPSLRIESKFPYIILSAQEVKALLLSHDGSYAISIGQVPGTNLNPTKVPKQRETL